MTDPNTAGYWKAHYEDLAEEFEAKVALRDADIAELVKQREQLIDELGAAQDELDELRADRKRAPEAEAEAEVELEL